MFGLADSVWLNTQYRGMMLQYHVGRIQWKKISNRRPHVKLLQITVGLFG